MENTIIEKDFPVHVTITGNYREGWTAEIKRPMENGSITITTLHGLTSAECFSKLGVQVPDSPIEDKEGRHAASILIDEGLKDISKRHLITSSEMQDLLLDIKNQLGVNSDQ